MQAEQQQLASVVPRLTLAEAHQGRARADESTRFERLQASHHKPFEAL